MIKVLIVPPADYPLRDLYSFPIVAYEDDGKNVWRVEAENPELLEEALEFDADLFYTRFVGAADPRYRYVTAICKQWLGSKVLSGPKADDSELEPGTVF